MSNDGSSIVNSMPLPRFVGMRPAGPASLVEVDPGEVVGDESTPWYQLISVQELSADQLLLTVRYPDGGLGERTVPVQEVTVYKN